MDSLVEQEFEKIKAQMGKPVTVVMVSHMGEEPPLSGILQDFDPYHAIEVFLGSGEQLSLSQACPFVGAMSGIRSIKDAQGNELYRNDGLLKWEDRFYNPFHERADNEFINSMVRAKFGEGHDYKMFE